ncbi:hypothetical protein HID58_021066 [Brassica napus]|uniref:Uncharacterized protein n=1 Tax=Brassica napus TaxID=3708 RepID=A0ABQ8CVJ7_BRANA|nr:hypothetical protein HID58_021066 [Brassica napus]
MFTQFNSLGSQNTKINHVVHELSRGSAGKPSYRKAIIRRVYDKSSGSLTLHGKHWSFSEEKEKKKKKKEKKRYALFKQRLGAYRAWRSASFVMLP